MRKFIRLTRLKAGRRQRALVRLTRRAITDETGGEVLEYALVAGLIVVGVITTIACVGGKVANMWGNVQSKLQS